MVIKCWNGRSDIIIFLPQASVIFIQENAAFIQVLIYQDWHNQLLNKPPTQTFLGLSHVPPHERRSWGGMRDEPKNVCVGGYSSTP